MNPNRQRLTELDRIANQAKNPAGIALYKALKALRSCVSFMNSGAHPDDETSAMLAVLGLREGIKLSYACANRGEGGQNAIGVEVSSDLGVVRTREMERAARVLNMSQYWLSTSPDDSIFDFGFSKSGDQTLKKWGEQRTLERFTGILRRERPDILCPTFLDIGGQHGHHRAMTKNAFMALLLAADPKAYPEQNLSPWQVKKLYLPAWSGAGNAYDDDEPPPPATLTIKGDGADPVLGADYAQIAQFSRSFHRTQGMGRWVEPGTPNNCPLNLAWSASGETGVENSIFDNLPKNLSELADYADAPQLKQTLTSAQNEMDAASNAWPNTEQVRHHAAAALKLIREAEHDCPEAAKGEIVHRLAAKQRQLANVLALSSQICARLSLSSNEVRPGETFQITLNLYAPKVKATPVLHLPQGWKSGPWQDGAATISVPENAQPANPYPDTWYPDRANAPLYVEINWLERFQDKWPRLSGSKTRPNKDLEPNFGSTKIEEALENGVPVSLQVDPEEDLHILPACSARLDPGAGLVNLANPKALTINLSHVFPGGAKASLAAGANWNVAAASKGFALSPQPGLEKGLYEIPLLLDEKPATTITRMFYEHTGPLMRCTPAVLRILALAAKLPDAHIAYIGGGSENMDQWLTKLGLNITSLDDEALAQTDFGEFDSVLVGVFALRTRPVLAKRLAVLHDWVREGGNLVTTYHRPWDNWDENNSALAYLKIGKPSLRWRITNENAAVKLLEPEHPLLNTPNKIDHSDWEGWHKERGLYFAAEWDPAYLALLEMADPGEAPLTGALLSGRFGKGRHTHTSLILHYQLDKLAPGAFRLLANLLAEA